MFRNLYNLIPQFALSHFDNTLKWIFDFQILSTLPNSASAWIDVFAKFWPTQDCPTHIQLRFGSENGTEIIAKLPANHAATQTLVCTLFKVFSHFIIHLKGPSLPD
jgi:hypothetical protein